MAKVMVSIPDDELRDLDAEAARLGMTRSGLLREYVRDASHVRTRQRVARLDEIAAMGERGAYDGTGVDHLRADRDRDG